jgi:hypothetical protein
MSSPIPPQDKPLQWNANRQPPPAEGDGTVTIRLEGLFSICFLTKINLCQLGIFNHDPKHRLAINVNGGNCTGGVTSYEYTHAQMKQLAKKPPFEIGIVGSNTDVSFFQQDERFNRSTSNVLKDFRWLIDVESPDLYNEATGSKQPHYAPKILVNNGVFFTSHLATDPQTGVEFDFDFVERRQHNPEIRNLGRVARQTEARISLAGTQVLRFKFFDPNGDAKTCEFQAGKPAATILIRNLCFEQTGQRCKHADYHLHFESFTPPRGKNKYDLVLRGAAPPVPTAENPTATSDEAPCHGMGYGNSGGGTQP